MCTINADMFYHFIATITLTNYTLLKLELLSYVMSKEIVLDIQ